MSARSQGHLRLDERSLALHRAIADKLRSDPGLLEIARENLRRWSQQNGRSQPYWDAWLELLNGPFEALLAALVEPGERMTAMRQATAFAGVLSPAERWAIYARFDSGRPE